MMTLHSLLMMTHINYTMNACIVHLNPFHHILIFLNSEMSAKRSIEISNGESRSNQQTASNSKCIFTVNVNNNNSDANNDAPASSQQPSYGKCLVHKFNEDHSDEVHAFDESDASLVETVAKGVKVTRNVPNEPTSSSKVTTRQVKVDPSTLQPSCKSRGVDGDNNEILRYVVLSEQPVTLRTSILASTKVKDTLIEIYTNMLINDNKYLLANIVDQSGKIILKADDFAKIVAVMLSADRDEEDEIKPGDVKLQYTEDILATCFKTTISPFKRVKSIVVNDQDMRIHQYEAYGVLTNNFRISGDIIYIEPEYLNKYNV